jgi:type VI secretion system protein ImpL
MRWALVALVLLVLAGIWVLSFFVPEVRWFAELLTAIVVLAAILIVVVPWTRERSKRAEADRASKGRALATGDRRPELVALRARLRKSFAEVKRLRGGRAGSRRLPLILAIGAPASGQKTMLEALGLAVLSPPSGRPGGRESTERDLGSAGHAASLPPTQSCDVWCSPEAIVVAVKVGTEDQQKGRDSWLALLDELRRFRRDHPVDGVWLTVGVPQIGSAEWASGGVPQHIRARVDDVVDRLETIVPVYLVFTMADRIPGFTEFWNGFPKPDDSTWGASFSPEDDRIASEPAKAVEREFALLGQALHARLIDQLPREADAARRVSVLRFPVEFQTLTSPVTRLVETLCRPGPALQNLVFRGFYFASAGPAPAAPRFFLTDLYRSVILPDRYLGARSPHALRRLARRDLRTSLLALAVSLVVVVPALASYVHNVELVDRVRAAGHAIAAADPSSTPGTHGDPIEPALDALNQCDHDADTFGISGWFAPRAARELRIPLAQAYVARLHAWMSQRLRRELERRLDAITAGHGLPDLPSTLDENTPLHDAYDSVKLVATLVQPAGHAHTEWAAQHLAAAWRSVLPEGDAVPAERLIEHARNYLAALEANADLAWPTGRSLVSARERLRRLDVRGMPYRRILLSARDAPPVRASAVFSPGSIEFLASRGDVQVPGPFTASGWPKIRAALHSPTPLAASVYVERWVLDDASLPADDAALRSQVTLAYFDEYVRRWMSFLDELKVKTPDDVSQAKAELIAFKEGDGFYKTIFELFGQNAIHDDEPVSLPEAGGLLSRIPWLSAQGDAAATTSSTPSPVERGFRPLLAFAGDPRSSGPGSSGQKGPGGSVAPLDAYLAILDRLKAALDAPPPAKPALQDAQSPFTEAGTGVAALLDGVEEPARGRLWRLLMPPVMGGVLAAKAEGMTTLSGDWNSAVYTAWDQKLRDHFPFARVPHAEPANFADFNGFFRPDGILWGFVHAHLADWVEENGDGRYVARQGADSLAPDMLACLTVAQEITDAFFEAGGEPGLRLSVQADWTASNVTAAKFWIGSKDTPLPRAEWSGPIRWLGEDVRVEWQQDGRPTEELGRHSFSLFDLFDHLGGLKPSPGSRSIYTSECPPLSLKLRPEGKIDALRSDFFSRLRCPEEVRVTKP